MEGNSTQLNSVMIIGGGLGGLVLAQFLKNSGIKVKIFERDSNDEARSQGLIVGLQTGGIDALSKLTWVPGLQEFLHSSHTVKFFLVNQNLDPYLGNKENLQRRTAVATNRIKLRELLTQGLDIEWNKKFEKYEEISDHVVAYFQDGTSFQADLLIGADGSKSKVRAQRTDKIVVEEVGVTFLGSFVTSFNSSDFPKLMSLLDSNLLIRAICPNHSFFIASKAQNQDGKELIFWGLSRLTSPNMYPEDAEGILKAVKEHAKLFHPDLVKLIELTPKDKLFFPRNFYSSKKLSENPLGKTCRVTLIGDAAHVMTAHRGLGANTAFVDAERLANALIQTNWYEALVNFEADMVARGFEAVDESLQATKILHQSDYFKSNLQNSVLAKLDGIYL